MTSQPITAQHPVVEFAHRVTTRLEQLASGPVWSMSPDDQREALRELARAEAQLSALRLRVLAEAERSGAGAVRAAASAADWVAVETRQTRISARSDLKLANALDHQQTLAAALESGGVNGAQARVIVTALDRLPTSGEFGVDTEQRQAAEAHVVDMAAVHDARALQVLGRRIFEVIAPDLSEAHDGKVLGAQEAAAARRTMLVMREDDAGTVHGRFRIPTLHGQWLKKVILALCSPARSTPTTTPPFPRRRHQHGQRKTPLRPPPPTHPRPPLRRHPATQRQGQLPPTNVTVDAPSWNLPTGRNDDDGPCPCSRRTRSSNCRSEQGVVWLRAGHEPVAPL